MADMNSSMAYTLAPLGDNALQTMTSFIPLVVIVSVLLGVLIAAYSSEWFKRFYKTFALLGKSFTYFIRGSLLSGIVACAYWLLSQLSRLTSEGTIPWEYFVYAVLGYLAMSVIGWYATVVYDALNKRNKKMKEQELNRLRDKVKRGEKND